MPIFTWIHSKYCCIYMCKHCIRLDTCILLLFSRTNTNVIVDGVDPCKNYMDALHYLALSSWCRRFKAKWVYNNIIMPSFIKRYPKISVLYKNAHENNLRIVFTIKNRASRLEGVSFWDISEGQGGSKRQPCLCISFRCICVFFLQKFSWVNYTNVA